MSPPESRHNSPPVGHGKHGHHGGHHGGHQGGLHGGHGHHNSHGVVAPHANSIPRIPPPAGHPVGRVASLSRPPLERASSVPERGIHNKSNSSSYNSSRSSMEKTGSVDKALREALTLVKERSRSSTDSLPAGGTTGSGGRGGGGGDSVGSSQQGVALPGGLYSSRHGSVNSMCINKGSLERITKGSRESLEKVNSAPPMYPGMHYGHTAGGASGAHTGNGGTNNDLIDMDENNMPIIDAAITPPLSPTKGGVATMFHSASLKGFARRKLPTLKFKQGRMGSLRSDRTSNVSSPSGSNPVNPTITITMNDVDRDSIVSDYLSPDINYKKSPGDHKVGFHNILGDDVSLYGTPKEELSPLKEVDPSAKVANNSATNYLKDQIVSFFQPSDNKLAMKLFGNKNALRKEKMRQKAAGNWVIHPCSNFR